jgi:hypothetical protein
MGTFGRKIFNMHKTDIHEHLQEILQKVEDEEKNGKGDRTKLQAKRLKELIKEVQDDYVRKETRKVR